MLGSALALLASGCTTSLPDGAFFCHEDRDCPPAQRCYENTCWRSEPPGAAIEEMAGSAALSGGPPPAANGGSTPAAASGGSDSSNDPASSGEYFRSGRLHGFAYVATAGNGTTIMPRDFSMVGAGEPRCVRGTIPGLPDYSGGAALGVNFAQDPERGAPFKEITPMGKGLRVTVDNRGGSDLSLQLQSSDKNAPWCYAISDGATVIPWKEFNTECWTKTGQAYANQPIRGAVLWVPGSDRAVTFEFCFVSLEEQ